MRTAILALCGVLAASAAAQSKDVLALERREDRRERDRLLRRLCRLRLAEVSLEDATPRELARYLARAAGGSTSFVVATERELPRVTLRLRRVTMAQLLAVLQDVAGVRFSFFAGVVKIVHPQELRELTSLRVYDLRAAVAPVPSRRPPRLGLGREEVDAGAEEETEATTVSGLTLDRIADLVRSHAAPDSWDRSGISLTATNGLLLVRQTESGHRAVARVLAALGAISRPRPRTASHDRRRPGARRR